MIRAHTANQGDLGAIYEIDLRCYDYPLEYITLKEHLKDPTCFVVIAADEKHKTIGFAIFKRDSSAGTLEIIRLAVLPKYRNLGAGAELLRAGRDFSITYNLIEMFVIVPEVQCNQSDPEDVSRWLRDQGFDAVLPLCPGKFRMYGTYYDGIRFTRKTDVT